MKTEFIRNVLPGDEINEKGFHDYGIFQKKSTMVGQLHKIEDLYFVKSKTKLYKPSKYDVVIGRVIYTNPEFYKVDLDGCIGILPVLSFLNASKRNRPELNRDDLVIAQVVKVNNTEPLLCCKKEGFGLISEAFKVPSWKIRLLYFSDFLMNISKSYNYKIVLAINGYIWLESEPETKLSILNEIDKIK